MPPTATLDASTIRQYGAADDGWVGMVALAKVVLAAWNAVRELSLKLKEPLVCLAERRSVKGCISWAQCGKKRQKELTSSKNS